MFSYYGSKKKIAHLYPAPLFDTIIEPFAGAAWYSILYRSRQVLINDKYSTIYGIWDWLINRATTEDLLTHKDFYLRQDISNLPLDKRHLDFIGFCINRGSTTPKSIVQKWSCQVAANPSWASTSSFAIERAAKYLSDIKHWNVSNEDYEAMPDIEATWFIDPIYQFGGKHYVENTINYSRLYEWIMSRRGQIIVCENTSADWMGFSPLVNISGQKHKTIEAFWTNIKTSLVSNKLFNRA